MVKVIGTRWWVAPTILYTPYQEMSCKSIRSTRRFEIFQIHLQRFATVIFVQLNLIHHIDARLQGRDHVSHAETNAIEESTALIIECDLQMFAFRTNAAE